MPVVQKKCMTLGGEHLIQQHAEGKFSMPFKPLNSMLWQQSQKLKVRLERKRCLHCLESLKECVKRGQVGASGDVLSRILL